MKKIVFVLVAVFCINNLAWSQEEKEEKVEKTQELRYFKEDDAFYSGGMRLLDSESERILSSNPSALEAWKKGNALKKANTSLKISTYGLLGVGGICTAVLPWASLLFDSGYHWEVIEVLMYVGYGLLAGGLITGIMIPMTKAKYKSCYSEAVGIYNKGFSTTAVSLKIGTIGNGLGFSLKF